MSNAFEKGPEKILSKDEVVEAILGFAEKAVFVRELTDEAGPYLIEMNVEGGVPGEITQYVYVRKGSTPDGVQAAETTICTLEYVDGDLCGGGTVADYDYAANAWVKES